MRNLEKVFNIDHRIHTDVFHSVLGSAWLLSVQVFVLEEKFMAFLLYSFPFHIILLELALKINPS